MKPVNSPPALFSLNGFGLGMAGRRGFDAETGTYVKSHCITALFVPVFALGAYRVADAENGGWYFLGKEEKSAFARIWNNMLIAGIATAIALGWLNAREHSPEYQAKQRLEQAEAHSKAGDHLEAAAVYKSMITQGLPSEAEAQAGLQNSLTNAFASDSPDTVVAAIEFANAIPDSYLEDNAFASRLGALADAGAQRFMPNKPEAAYRILAASAKLPNPPEGLAGKQQAILESLVENQPANHEFAVALAGLYEESDRINEAFALLEPHIDTLGTGEGSRILGQILLAKGQPAEAIPLLEKYIEPRLKQWRKAAAQYRSETESAYQRVITRLENNQGTPTFYSDYEKAATDEAKARIVDDYVYERMQRDQRFLAAGRRYEEAGRIVPVIMDLGISQLHAAQASADPAERKALLDKAEKQFLSLKDSAGDSGKYKFLLGQVYYWSGRQDKGRALFDQVLAADSRAFNTLVTLSNTMREIGNVVEARALAEEAYGKAANDEEKNTAAGQRALVYKDTDDQIAWLEKIKGGGLSHKTSLAAARADKAMADGNTEEAIKQLRISEDGWSKLPVSPSSLNNAALVQFQLFRLTGDIACHQKGSNMMERAVALSPDNSILLGNAAGSLTTTAMMQVADGKIGPRILREGIGFETLRFLYQNDASRSTVVSALAANENYTRAMTMFDRAILLSPNSRDLYALAIAFHGYTLNYEALERLGSQLEAAKLDHSEAIAQHEKFLRGENDTKMRTDMATGLRHQEELLSEVTDEADKLRIGIATSEIRMSLFAIGQPADLDQEIAFLRKAHAEQPSVRSSNALVNALAQKACLALAEHNAGFAELLQKCRRIAGAKDILVLALTSDQLKPLVLANPEAKAALAEDLLRDALFPATLSASSVIIAAAIAPEQLPEAKSQFAANRFDPLSERLAAILAPWSPNVPIDQYLRLVAADKHDEARAVLENARAAGIQVPTL